MSTPSPDSFSLIKNETQTIEQEGFGFIAAKTMASILGEAVLKHWGIFAESWDNLGDDRYMADAGRYRRRKYAVFAVDANTITRKPHQPHYQSRDYNPLNGDIERWFAPMDESTLANPVFIVLMQWARATITHLTPKDFIPQTWHAEIHQFRIEANQQFQGKPTPEGMHRDGVDWVFVVMINRKNIEEGTTIILDIQRQPLGSFTLLNPLDTVIVNDNRVFHGVTPIKPQDQNHPAYRDVLVLTFRHQ
ncbi:2OG-Fe dioxygenase family protein [Entomobacter blattae]|uniref:L-isoleucine-4-hydroxylase n=1 Tax=Entomobacter blattae TaxID=2762277 RepID=A0A7H1NNY3_9PROT|nr:2OG-Fe dioxygenase family protein [Entomobacter blattae]QNT77493.1 L-isoleucine-4-hydroxylase [Entomobacter blattae]